MHEQFGNHLEKDKDLEKQDKTEEPDEQNISELPQEETERTKERFSEFEGMGQIVLGASGFRIKIDRTIDTLAFDHKSREVLVNPDFIIQNDITDDEQLYAFTHEIAHFVQLSQDADGYLGTFETAKEKAKDWPLKDRQQIEKSWHRFFNIFLDIHDNSIHENRMPRFQNLDNPENPRYTLYKKLFEESDFTQLPKHIQFCNAALRRAMLPDEEVMVSEEVSEAIDKPFLYLGKEYRSFQEFVNKKIYSHSEDLSAILFRLETAAQPIFEKFLEEDSKEGKLEYSPDNYDKFISEGFMSKEVAEGAVKAIKESDKSTAERVKDQMQSDFQDKMTNAGFREGEIKRMGEIMERSNDVFRDLEDLWRVFLQISFVEEWKKESGYRTGVDISVDEFVRQLPTLLAKPEDTRLFERWTGVESERSIKPKKIHLQFALDLSGSMDTEKREATQEATYALAKSLIMFRRNVNLDFNKDGEGETPFDINLRFLGFGSDTKDLFEYHDEEKQDNFVSDENPNDLDIRLWQAIMNIGKIDLGGTEDAKALKKIFDDLKDVGKDKKLDVFVRGIKIPGEIYDDELPTQEEDKGPKMPKILPSSGVFEKVWGEKGQRLDYLDNLREVMKKILFSSLQDQERSDSDEVVVVIEITDGETGTESESRIIIKQLEDMKIR